MYYQGDILPLRAAQIKVALQDALQTSDPALASEARIWLAREGYTWLLDRKEAQQFTPEKRRRGRPKLLRSSDLPAHSITPATGPVGVGSGIHHSERIM